MSVHTAYVRVRGAALKIWRLNNFQFLGLASQLNSLLNFHLLTEIVSQLSLLKSLTSHQLKS